MPGWLDGLLLGLVQGLTEFLPVSSSGHLVLGEALLGYDPPGISFEIGLHVATLLSVLIAFAPRVRTLAVGLVRGEGPAWRYAGLLALGSVPAAIAGIGFRDFFAARFQPGVGLGVNFLLTAAILWSTRWAVRRPAREGIGPVAALGIGVAQAVAILPAVSRSGTTIAAALWGRVGPAAAAEFSFLLSVVAIAGSAVLEVRHIESFDALLTGGFAAAFLAALLSGIWAIRFLVRLLERGRFHHFAWYCAAVGVLTIAWFGAAAR